jgi:hypothetical protein
MPTADWREEKSSYVVKALCKAIASQDTPEPIKDRLANEGLWNALKLYADALEERLGTNETKWSPALVELFIKRPEQCDQWLDLMAEPEFSASAYWNKPEA